MTATIVFCILAFFATGWAAAAWITAENDRTRSNVLRFLSELTPAEASAVLAAYERTWRA
jgi:hypothetical protein